MRLRVFKNGFLCENAFFELILSKQGFDDLIGVAINFWIPGARLRADNAFMKTELACSASGNGVYGHGNSFQSDSRREKWLARLASMSEATGSGLWT